MTSLVDRYRQMLNAGAPIESVINLMRQDGKSRIESIHLLVDLTGRSLSEAKAMVHASSTWKDLRDSAEKLHHDLEDAGGKGAKKSSST